MASIVDRYRNAMLKRLPESDDNLLFKYHKQAVEMAMETFYAKELMKEAFKSLNKKELNPAAPFVKEAIGEAFMEMIDLNWKKGVQICHERLLEEVKNVEAGVMGENYWSTMKRVSKKYNDAIGESLHSKMQFIRLEYLNGRQDKDVKIMMKEIQEQANESGANAAAAESSGTIDRPTASAEDDVVGDVTAIATAAAAAAASGGTIDTAGAAGAEEDVVGDATARASTTSSGVAEASEDRILPLSEPVLNESIVGASEQHLEKELKLRMTWGRAMIFWRYWIDCRKETIDLLNKILDNFKDTILQGKTNPVKVFLKWIVTLDGFENISLQFAHTINKDLSCYKVLHGKLAEFLNLVTSGEYLEAFGVEPKDLLFNISTLQTNISTRQPETCRGFEMCEEIVDRNQERPRETAKLLACTSRPLLHLKDVLKKLSEEDKLNQVGIKGVIDDLQQEETAMSTMFSESLLTFNEVFTKVNNGTEQLQKDIKEWLPTREESIVKMNEIIKKLNKTTKDVAIAQTVSSSVGIVGGAIAIVGLILAPFTFGASLIPSAIAAGVVSGLGAAAGIGSAIAEIVIDKDEIKAAMTCIEEDEVLFKKLASQLESSKRNFTMFLRYIPEDELEPFIAFMTDTQSTDKGGGASRIQIDPQIGFNAVCFGSFVGKAALMPVTRMAFTGAIVASRAVLLTVVHSVVAIGVALDIANLVLASVKLGKGAKSENAEQLEDVVKKMEEERDTMLKLSS